jgi:hypothetical protein
LGGGGGVTWKRDTKNISKRCRGRRVDTTAALPRGTPGRDRRPAPERLELGLCHHAVLIHSNLEMGGAWGGGIGAYLPTCPRGARSPQPHTNHPSLLSNAPAHRPVDPLSYNEMVPPRDGQDTVQWVGELLRAEGSSTVKRANTWWASEQSPPASS